MTAWAAPAAALLLGWALARLVPAGALPRPVGVMLLAPLAAGAWAIALAFAGAPWSPLSLALPLAAVPLSLVLRRPALASLPSPWGAAAAAAALARAGLVAALPAFGWDFRYIWGLKARVFAAAGGLDAAWLAWPGHGFAHPSYPPLWSALLAGGVVLGAPAAEVAAAWGALLVLALAAVCWWAAGDAPPAVRALAASAGAWAPTILAPRFSGYAEPLLAVFAAAALGALARLPRRADGALPVLALAVAGLALAKQEGTVLAAAALFSAAIAVGPRRVVLAAVPAVGLAAAWWAFVALHRLPAGEYAAGLAGVAGHLAALPAAILAALRPGTAAILAAWALVALCLRNRAPGLALAVWLAAVLAAYLASSAGLAWQLANSLDRVLGAPLPGALAVALGSAWGAAPVAASDLVSQARLPLDRRAPRL